MAKNNDNKNWFARHKFMTVLLVLFVVIVIAAVSSGGKSEKSASTGGGDAQASGAKASGSDAAPAKLGEKVRDGKFEFVVQSVKCGETSVGQSEYLQAKAQGQFCRVQMSVTNIGDKSQSLFADNQKLLDGAGREYSYSSQATLYAAPSSSATWYNEINPGNTVSGDIIFDVPAATTPVTAVLHDSSFSGGVKVTLQ